MWSPSKPRHHAREGRGTDSMYSLDGRPRFSSFEANHYILKDSHQDTIVNIEKAQWQQVGFKAHHPELATRTPDSLDRARIHGAAAEVLDGFFSLYGLVATYSILKERPDLIFNCD